jgi:hypothetical protein
MDFIHSAVNMNIKQRLQFEQKRLLHAANLFKVNIYYKKIHFFEMWLILCRKSGGSYPMHSRSGYNVSFVGHKKIFRGIISSFKYSLCHNNWIFFLWHTLVSERYLHGSLYILPITYSVIDVIECKLNCYSYRIYVIEWTLTIVFCLYFLKRLLFIPFSNLIIFPNKLHELTFVA